MNYENYDPSFPDQSVVDLYLPIWAKLPAFKSKPAFVWVQDGSTQLTMGSTLTYAQLSDSVQTISSHLLQTLRRGDTIVVLCSPGLELVEIIFGCQRSGLLCVPISPPDPVFDHDQNYSHLVRVLSQTKPKAAIAHHEYIKSVGKYINSSFSSNNKQLAEMLKNLQWISTEDLKEQNPDLKVLKKNNGFSYNGCKPEDVYLIQYTSGATGIPKPVLVTAGSAAHNVRTARKSYDLHPNSVIVSWLPQYHDCGLMFLLLTIVSGATCVLTCPKTFVKRPRIWLELISEFKATCTPVPSFTLPLVVKRGGIEKGNLPINLGTMKNLIIINEPIYESSVEEFVGVFKHFGLDPSSLSPSYGLAENCTFVSTAWRSINNLKNSATYPNIPLYNKLLPSARLEEDEEVEIMVVNEETHELVEDGVEGEIWVSSASNCSGYLGHPSLTREVFQARTPVSYRRFVRTGDRGIVQGEERFLYVIGRCSDVIKLQKNGEIKEIHPHYIESAAYNSCPKFLRGGCLAAFEISGKIYLVGEMQRSEKEIRVLRGVCERIREGVWKEEKVEVGMVVLVKGGSVPKTTSGKIQRWRAKDKLEGGEMEVVMGMQFDGHGGHGNGSFLQGFGRRNGGGRGRGRGEESRPFLQSLL